MPHIKSDSYLHVFIFWDIELCSPYVNQRFGGTCHLHPQGWKAAEKETGCSRWPDIHTTQNCIPEDGNMHNNYCENLKSYTAFCLFVYLLIYLHVFVFPLAWKPVVLWRSTEDSFGNYVICSGIGHRRAKFALQHFEVHKNLTEKDCSQDSC
jgi:hypothetical protein